MADAYKWQQKELKKDLERNVRQSGQLGEINYNESEESDFA